MRPECRSDCWSHSRSWRRGRASRSDSITHGPASAEPSGNRRTRRAGRSPLRDRPSRSRPTVRRDSRSASCRNRRSRRSHPRPSSDRGIGRGHTRRQTPEPPHRCCACEVLSRVRSACQSSRAVRQRSPAQTGPRSDRRHSPPPRWRATSDEPRSRAGCRP